MQVPTGCLLSDMSLANLTASCQRLCLNPLKQTTEVMGTFLKGDQIKNNRDLETRCLISTWRQKWTKLLFRNIFRMSGFCGLNKSQFQRRERPYMFEETWSTLGGLINHKVPVQVPEAT
jgi:hypothetical protein